MTLAERWSRMCLTKKVFSKDAGEVSSAIISMLSGYKDVCHMVTFDNGGEFSEHQAIAEALEAEMYFAHPYASHERGLNENTNGLLRQFIPKGTDLRTVSEEDLERYLGALNSKPRKCLGFRQPAMVFAELRMAAWRYTSDLNPPFFSIILQISGRNIISDLWFTLYVDNYMLQFIDFSM